MDTHECHDLGGDAGEECGASHSRSARPCALAKAVRARGRVSGERSVHADRDVILVDLSGTAENRRVMRTVARWIVRMDVLAKRVRRQPSPRVLLFAPAADGKSVEWPHGADLIFTDELLDDDAIRKIDDWVERLASRLVHEGARFWPSAGGVGLGHLNLLQIQDFLLNYGQVTESLRRLLMQGNGRCIILSGYPNAAEALRRDVAEQARETVVHTLPKFRPPFLRRSTADEKPGRWDNRLGSLKPRVLIVSESRPMAGLFAAVEKQLVSAGLTPGLRIQYDVKGRGFEVGEGISFLHLIRPELVSVQGTRFRKEYERYRSHLLEFGTRDDPYHPPLDLLLGTLFANVLPRQARHVEELRQIIRVTRPELVIVGNDRWWLGMAAVLVAREEGIPTLAVQDGVAWDTPIWTSATADHVAVNGNQLEGFLRERGVSPGQLSVVGQPRYDAYSPEAATRVRPGVRSRLGLADDQCAVLFATQPNQDASYVSRIVEAILAIPDVRLLLRPHPSTSTRARARIAQFMNGDRVLSAADGDIFDFIAASDVVVVQNSTVALEAALLNRPVITANLTGMPDVIPYARLGISTEAKDSAGVTALVRRAKANALPTAATDERARAGIYYLVGPTDGRSAQRVADLIGDMLAQRAPR